VKILGFPFGDTWTNPKLKQLADDFSDLKIEFKKTNSNIISDFLD
jgi:hypothetical protein